MVAYNASLPVRLTDYGLRDYGTAQWEGGDAECDHLRPPLGGDGTTSGLNAKYDDTGAFDGKQHPRLQQYRSTCPKCGAIRVDNQIGLEETPEQYVENMVAVFREVKRVLRDDGVCWINLGDSFADKQLLGIPWRTAFALQADGWYLRSEIIWHKPNPMPESCTDRPTKSHEQVFLLSKSARYFYDHVAVMEENVSKRPEGWEHVGPSKEHNTGNDERYTGLTHMGGNHQTVAGLHRQKGGVYAQGTGRNRRTVWTIPTAGVALAHFATYPPALVEPCVLAGTSAAGRCGHCGKAWERVVEKTGE